MLAATVPHGQLLDLAQRFVSPSASLRQDRGKLSIGSRKQGSVTTPMPGVNAAVSEPGHRDGAASEGISTPIRRGRFPGCCGSSAPAKGRDASIRATSPGPIQFKATAHSPMAAAFSVAVPPSSPVAPMSPPASSSPQQSDTAAVPFASSPAHASNLESNGSSDTQVALARSGDRHQHPVPSVDSSAIRASPKSTPGQAGEDVSRKASRRSVTQRQKSGQATATTAASKMQRESSDARSGKTRANRQSQHAAQQAHSPQQHKTAVHTSHKGQTELSKQQQVPPKGQHQQQLHPADSSDAVVRRPSREASQPGRGPPHDVLHLAKPDSLRQSLKPDSLLQPMKQAQQTWQPQAEMHMQWHLEAQQQQQQHEHQLQAQQQPQLQPQQTPPQQTPPQHQQQDPLAQTLKQLPQVLTSWQGQQQHQAGSPVVHQQPLTPQTIATLPSPQVAALNAAWRRVHLSSPDAKQQQQAQTISVQWPQALPSRGGQLPVQTAQQASPEKGQLPVQTAQQASPDAQDSMPPVAMLNLKPYVLPDVAGTVSPAQGVETLSALEVYELLRSRTCVLVDVRGDDRAAGLIEGAVHVPAIDEDGTMFASRVPEQVKQLASHSLVVFTCQYSAHRAPTCANAYREAASAQQRVAILAGGFRAWEGTGFPVMAAAASDAEAQVADDYAMNAGQRFAHGSVMSPFATALGSPAVVAAA